MVFHVMELQTAQLILQLKAVASLTILNWSDGETTEDISNLGVGTYSVDITDANGCTFNIPSIEITEPDELTITETHSLLMNVNTVYLS